MSSNSPTDRTRRAGVSVVVPAYNAGLSSEVVTMRANHEDLLCFLRIAPGQEGETSVRLLMRDEERGRVPHLPDGGLGGVEAALEAVPDIKAQLARVRAVLLLGSIDPAKRLEAANLLAAATTSNAKTALIERLKVEDQPVVKAALQRLARAR